MNITPAADKALQALLKQSEGDYEAFLYDCDGTLADSMEAHKITYIKVAEKAGLTIDPAIIDEFAGLPIPDVVVEINKRYNSNFDPHEFETAKSDLFYKEYIGRTKPIEFVIDHLKTHVGKQRIAVVSGGSRAIVAKTLEVLEIAPLVELLVCAGETAKGKPHPDPFLEAARQLGVAPGKCLVFEDGDPGVQAAEAAGMDWIRIDKVLEATNPAEQKPR